LKPWPIDAEIVSPAIHGCLKRRSFHALVGTMPVISWRSGMPVRLPRPNAVA
jgi:hypothetical protein